MRKNKISMTDIIISIILIGITITCLVPILNTISISLSDRVSAGLGKVYVWPINFTIAPYEEILKDKQFFTSFLVSIFRVLLGGVINVFFCITMAYPLSKDVKAFRAKNMYMWFLVFTMLFNGGLVPSYLLVQNLGLVDSIWALVLPGAVPVFSIILLMNYFKSIPSSLEEAALMDGANPFYIMWKIFVPLAKPAIAVITLFAVVGHWNAFFDGLIYINTPGKYPLQTYIQTLSVSIDYQNINSLSPQDLMKQMAISDLTFNSAKVVVSMIPILLIYPLLQRYFVTGIIMGAVKE
ncbi:MAG TPA: carbohydrate ABC transporter permease [Ruminiclostridium sp.]